jgi:hypothetical protein
LWRGDIAAMLETGNLGGKCGDINALFVGLCRSAGVPARDVYGIRLVPSAFGYKELSGNPANLARAQHCRAEVFLAKYGWVAMDPADVGKVMRLETPEWLKTTEHPVVAPVNRALFGGWEGNWRPSIRHDVVLPARKARSSVSSCIPTPRMPKAASTRSSPISSSTRSRRAKSRPDRARRRPARAPLSAAGPCSGPR